MKCEKCEELLVGYLYQELSAKKMIEVEKHLQNCRLCARTLESWQTIHAGYQKTMPDEEASPFLKQRILMAAKEQLSKEPSWIESALASLRPVIVLPIVLVSLLAVLYLQFLVPQPKIASKRLEAPKPQAASESRRPELSDRRQLSEEQKRDLKSLGYVTGGEADRDSQIAARRKAAPESPANVTSAPAESSDEFGKDSRSDAPLAQAPPPAAPEPAPPVQEQSPAGNEDSMSRSEAKQEQLGLGQKAAKVAGLTGVSNYQQAQLKFRENNLKEGWTYANKAIEEDKTGSLASEFHSMGIQFQASKDYDKAIVQFELIVDHYRDYAYMEDVLLRLAQSQTELGQFEQARAVYQRLLRISPSNKDAMDHLGELNKKEKAQRQLKSLEAEKQQE